VRQIDEQTHVRQIQERDGVRRYWPLAKRVRPLHAVVGIASPRHLPRLECRLNVSMHLLRLLARPNPVVVPLTSLPYVVVQGEDQHKAPQSARLQISQRGLCFVNRSTHGLLTIFQREPLLSSLICPQQLSQRVVKRHSVVVCGLDATLGDERRAGLGCVKFLVAGQVEEDF